MTEVIAKRQTEAPDTLEKTLQRVLFFGFGAFDAFGVFDASGVFGAFGAFSAFEAFGEQIKKLR